MTEPVKLFTRCTFGPNGEHDLTTLGTQCFYCGKDRILCARFEPSLHAEEGR